MAKIDFAHKAQRKMFEAILDSVIKHSNSDRTKAIKQLVDLVKKTMYDIWGSATYEMFGFSSKPDSKWMKYIDNLLNDVHPNIIKAKALNTAYEAGYRGFRIAQDMKKKHDINIPWIILVAVSYTHLDAKDIANPHGDIVFDNVTFSYNKEEGVLNDISFTVPSGSNVALVGPSGGGKTTITSLIPHFYDISSGSITIGGQDIRDIKLKSLRESIGIVQQDVYLFDGTIRDNIAYGKVGATDDEIMEAARQADIEELINSLPDGLDTLVGERGTRLSGGQKQRISIARIFLKNPTILILDEATSALDNESERHIQASLEKLSKGRTTITIAHRLSTIRNADCILVVENGKITSKGTHDELAVGSGTYARYFELSRA